jgi:hypothetical protein
VLVEEEGSLRSIFWCMIVDVRVGGKPPKQQQIFGLFKYAQTSRKKAFFLYISFVFVPTERCYDDAKKEKHFSCS